jgi:thioredoxin reductase
MHNHVTASASEPWDTIIIGGGVAGLSAALMLGRARRRVLVIDAGQPRNRFASHMHAVLGHEGIDPAELLRIGRADASAFGVEFMDASVTRVDDSGEPDPGDLTVTTDDGTSYAARTLIVATGITDRLPDIPGLAERWGTSVLHCPYCHGWEVRDRRLGVLATSPMALHQVQLLRQWSNDVVLFAGLVPTLDAPTRTRLGARGIRIVDQAVVEVLGSGNTLTGVRLEDGTVVEIDAIFTGGAPEPHDRMLEALTLDRADGPMGNLITVDAVGLTSHPRVWAVGNVVNPGANVPLAMGTGSFAGAAVNAALVTREFDAAIAAHETPQAPIDFWEQRYAGADRVWSGRVNATLEAIARDLEPGRALDLGCGEGGDAIWLAENGWHATGVDLSPTAIDRARTAATARGLTARTTFVVSDLSTYTDTDTGTDPDAKTDDYDLVTASFLQSPVHLPREQILRAATELVAPHGRLLIVGHAAAPAWAPPEHMRAVVFPTPEGDLAALHLDPTRWQTLVCEVRERAATAPDGSQAVLLDSVVLVQRTS